MRLSRRRSRCRFPFELLRRLTVSCLSQPGDELHEIAGLGRCIELSLDQAIPGGFDCIEGARKNKHDRSIGHARQAATLKAAGADRFKREHPEQFAETVDAFVEQRLNRFRGAVSPRQSGAAAGDDHLHSVIGDPGADAGTDLVAIVGADPALRKAMTSSLQPPLQGITSTILRQGAGIGNRQQGNRKSQCNMLRRR